MKYLTTELMQEELVNNLSSSNEIVIVSPFINFYRFFDLTDSNLITIVTSFSKEIFIKGSSDIAFFETALERKYCIKHIEKLHAKIYLFDDCIILGSSNFTYSGLKNNVESNIRISKDDKNFDSIKAEIKKLIINGSDVSSKMIEEMTKYLEGQKINFKEIYYKKQTPISNELQIMIRPGLFQFELKKHFLNIFMKHEHFFELSGQIKDELEKTSYSYISFDSYQRLLKWIYPLSDESKYKNASETVKELCVLLFGYLLPEKIQNHNFRNCYLSKNDKKLIKNFHEENLFF